MGGGDVWKRIDGMGSERKGYVWWVVWKLFKFCVDVWGVGRMGGVCEDGVVLRVLRVGWEDCRIGVVGEERG